MPAGKMRLSVVENVGEYASSCGYCGREDDCSVAHGMWAHQLTVDAYQDLLDRGWRRSGCWLYKPLHERTCCPPYTIRLDVHRFAPDKEHRRVLRKMEAFLAGLPLTPARPHQPAADRQQAAAAPSPAVAVCTEDALPGDSLPAGVAGPGPAGAADPNLRSACATAAAGLRSCSSSELRGLAGSRRKPDSQPDAGDGDPAGASPKKARSAPPSACAAQAAGATAGPRVAQREDRALLAQADVLRDVMRQAVQQCVATGDLPTAQYPDAKVARPSARQRKALPDCVKLTSATALAVAATARKAEPERASQFSGPAVAEWLANRINAALQPQAPGPGSWGWQAACANGYLNFSGQQPDHADVCSPALPQPTSAGAVADSNETVAAAGGVQPLAGSGAADQDSSSECLPPACFDSLADCSASCKASTQVNVDARCAATAADFAPVLAQWQRLNGHAGGLAAADLASSLPGTPWPPSVAESCAASGGSPRACAEAAASSGRPEAWGGAPALAGLDRARSRRLRIVLVRPSRAVAEAEYPLYKKYQVLHHGDRADQVPLAQFKRFLVDTPLMEVPPGGSGTPTCGFGTFHQQYWLDDTLVAVGVVDVLPRCLSSKYFFWDPELAPLAPGKFSALQEISWVQAQAAVCPTLRYYYLGYYIHSCPKMRYKADYRPSDLLCPVSLAWVPHERVQAALDACSGGFLALSQVAGAGGALHAQAGGLAGRPPQRPDTPSIKARAVANTLIFVSGGGRDSRLLPFGQLAQLDLLPPEALLQLQEKLVHWHGLVGHVAERLVYLL